MPVAWRVAEVLPAHDRVLDQHLGRREADLPLGRVEQVGTCPQPLSTWRSAWGSRDSSNIPVRTGAMLSSAPQINRVGAMLTLFFTERPVIDFATAKTCDTERFGAFFRGLVQNGVAWPPSQFEAAFISLAHSDDDIQLTIEAIQKTLGTL